MNEVMIDNSKIENMIYEIRGKHVMFNSDVARLYNVETKVLNQVIKRNINRFPEEFCFQITIEELENQEIASNKFITIEKYFNDYEKIVLNERKLQLFLNGVQLTYELKDGIYKIYKENEFVGIGTVKNKLLKRDIIL